MDKTTFKNKELLGAERKRSANTNLLCSSVILPCCDSPRKTKNRLKLLRNLTNIIPLALDKTPITQSLSKSRGVEHNMFNFQQLELQGL